jgi:Domain of unknown function (DUF4258)
MAKPKPVTSYHLTSHAQIEMARRQISEEAIRQVLRFPEQIELIRPGRAVYQSRLEIGNPSTTYLIRIFVDYEHEPPDVVTVYRTSKIDKYWRSGS